MNLFSNKVPFLGTGVGTSAYELGQEGAQCNFLTAEGKSEVGQVDACTVMDGGLQGVAEVYAGKNTRK